MKEGKWSGERRACAGAASTCGQPAAAEPQLPLPLRPTHSHAGQGGAAGGRGRHNNNGLALLAQGGEGVAAAVGARAVAADPGPELLQAGVDGLRGREGLLQGAVRAWEGPAAAGTVVGTRPSANMAAAPAPGGARTWTADR